MDLKPYAPRTFDALLSQFISYVAAKGVRLTNWKPGSRIRTLSEAIIFILVKISGDFQAAYEHAIREACFETFGFGKLPGFKSVGFVRYVKADVVGSFSIPQFRIDLFGVRYRTVSTATIVEPATFVDIDIIADNFGPEGNIQGLEIDTVQGRGDITDSLTGEELVFDRIFNPFPISGGEGEESDEKREIRFQGYIQNLARSTLDGIRNAVLSIPGVVEAFVDENKNPYTGAPETGWVLVYISDGTALVSSELIDTVFDIINGVVNSSDVGYKGGGVQLFVGTIEIEPINVDYELDVLDTSALTDEQVESISTIAISNYVNRLKNGNNVVYDLLWAAGLSSHPDFQRIRFNTPTADVSVPTGKIPKIGGTGGGTIACTTIVRIPKP
ncbi:baseplate J/gp47 family protein [Leptospira sp. GIMC2001]|uniref:baseplate J/gp47 family protein n=1 Tax=Leptospira sp. GIMC2001 TaxID=1513297 RepID=UPI00234BD8DE|nr:baseplate J/gp47 family protein [Leptospira sp. GIMC2001]WCL51430.1 baseplate J/gp47 family protein [Leptospira sp. GIMC2001]